MVTFTDRGKKIKGSTFAILITDVLRCRGNLGINIISYSSPRRDVSQVHSQSVRDIRRDSFLGIILCQRRRRVQGHSCPMVGDGPRGTVRSLCHCVRRRSTIFSIMLFSLPKALHDRKIIRAVSTVSCVFVPLGTSGIIVRDSLRFTRIIRRRLVTERGYGLGNVCLF